MCAPPYACRRVTVTRGTRGAGKRSPAAQAPWRMTPARSCAVPGRNPGVSDEDDERQAEAVAQLDEPGALLAPPRRRGSRRGGGAGWRSRRPASRRSGRSRRRGCAPSAARARAARRRRPAARSRRARRRPRAARAGRGPDGSPASGAAGGASGSGPPDDRGQVGEQRRATTSAAATSSAATRWATPLRAWTRGPPSSSARDLLARDCLDHLRAGEEQPRARARHHREVAERRRVGGAAGARPAMTEICGTRAVRLRAEDRRVGVQRRRALLQSRAAGVREADDGRAGAVGRARSCARSSRRRRRRASRPGRPPSCAHAYTARPATRPAARHDAVAHGAAHGPERARVAAAARSGRAGSPSRRGRGDGGAQRRSCRPDRQAGVLAAEAERVATARASGPAPRAARRARSRGRTRGRAPRS